MKRIKSSAPILSLILGVGLGGMLSAEEAEVAELRETIAQWAEAEELISEEKAAWQAKKASMTQLLELYREELALLDEELSTAGQSSVELDEKQQRLQQETAAMRHARAETTAALAQAKALLLPLVEKFPKPLQDELHEPIDQLAAWKSGDELRPGLQALLSILDQANRVARRVTQAREVRDGREVEVIYAGLSHAYYLSRDGGAGVGELTASGWRWQERKDMHGKIKSVIAQLEERSPPGLVTLPVPGGTRGGSK